MFASPLQSKWASIKNLQIKKCKTILMELANGAKRYVRQE
jgi:hypothetical protein